MQEEAKPKPKPKVAAPVPSAPPPQVVEAAESKPAPLPPVPDVAGPLPSVPIPMAGAPHIAEKEHVVSAQILTLKSPSGDTTIMVERERGKAIHATVIDEKPNEDATKAAKDAQAVKAEETARKGRASRRASKRAAPHKPTDASAEKKGKRDEQAER